MKIAIDVSDLNQDNWDGTRQFIYNTLKELFKVDKKNHYYLFYREDLTDKLKKLKNNKTRIIVSKFPFFWTQTKFAYELFKLKPDLLWMPLHALPIIRPKKSKTIVTLHDLAFMQFSGLKKNFDQRLLVFMTRYVAKNANKITTISNFCKKDIIKKLNISKEKIKIIYHGFNKKEFKEKSKILNYKKKVNNIRNKLKIKGEYIFFVGGLAPRKNLIRLIEAYTFLRNNNKNIKTKLVLGGAKAWVFEEIIDKAKHSRYSKDIIFTGYISKEDLPILMSEATCFAFPSLLEGFGIPVLEAQASGTVVLTSNISALPEVGGKNGAYYINPFSIKEITNGLNILLSTKSIRDTLIKNGFENVKQYSWEKTAKCFFYLFEEVYNS